jgi:hypothetical protein
MMRKVAIRAAILLCATVLASSAAVAMEGYLRNPDLHGGTVWSSPPKTICGSLLWRVVLRGA